MFEDIKLLKNKWKQLDKSKRSLQLAILFVAIVHLVVLVGVVLFLYLFYRILIKGA